VQLISGWAPIIQLGPSALVHS